MDKKLCTNCKQDKELSCFSKWRNSTTGEPLLQAWCKECSKAYGSSEKRKKRNRENQIRRRTDPIYKAQELATNKARRVSHRVVYLIASARFRANKLGVPFNLTPDNVIIPSHCPILGVEMKMHTRYAASIDRLDLNKGYVIGNILVISWMANCMKNSATREELLKFSHFWLNNTHLWDQ